MNWSHRATGGIGGCETVFDDLARALGIWYEVRLIDYTVASRALGIGVSYGNLSFPEVEGSYIIDKYIRDYLSLFGGEETLLITNAGVSNCWIEHPCRSIAFFNDPYLSLWREMNDSGLLNPIASNRYAGVCSFLQRRTGEHSDKNVAPSRFMAENDMRELGIEADEIIPNGVDLDRFYPIPDKSALRRKYGIPVEQKVVVWSGSSHPLKWHLIPDIVKSLRDVFFVLVFKHPLDYCPRLRNVKVFSCVSHDQMRDIYNLADAFLLPSMVENCNLSIFEAMACNLPVVVSRTGFFADKDGVTDFGWVVSKWDPEEYVHAVREVLSGRYIFKSRDHLELNSLTIDDFRTRWKSLIEQVMDHADEG